ERLVWVIAPVLARIAPILAYPSLHIYDFWQWCGIAVQIAASWRKLQTDWRAKIRKRHKSPDVSAIQLLELRYLDSSFSIRSLRFTQKRRVRSVNSRVVLWPITQHRQQLFRLARHLHFPRDLARVIHNADAGLLDRY